MDCATCRAHFRSKNEEPPCRTCAPHLPREALLAWEAFWQALPGLFDGFGGLRVEVLAAFVAAAGGDWQDFELAYFLAIKFAELRHAEKQDRA